MRRETLASVFGIIISSLLLLLFINNYEIERNKYENVTSASCEVIASNYTKYVYSDSIEGNPKQRFTGIVSWKASIANWTYYLNETWNNNFIPDIGMTRTCWCYANKVRFYNPDDNLNRLNTMIYTMIFMIFVLFINIGFEIADRCCAKRLKNE